jgi:S1-C subfamily serine protease
VWVPVGWKDLTGMVPRNAGSMVAWVQVLCIGNPFGFDHTLTTGVISGLDREIQSR